MSSRSLLRFLLLLPPLAALLLAGCGRYGTLHGTITYKGKPVPKATITFLSSGGGVAVGMSDSEGNYQAFKVPLGEAKVSAHNLTQLMPVMMGQMMGKQKDAGGKDSGKDSKAGIDQMMKQLAAGKGDVMMLPLKANDPERSGIVVDVQRGSQEFNIELTD